MRKVSIDDRVLEELLKIFSNFKCIERAKVFGSRARGDFNERSDIDICLFGEISHQDFAMIYMDIDEINTYLKFDVLNFKELNKKELIDNIMKEGINIYG